MSKLTGTIVTLIVAALWIAFYVKTGFTIEGTLAGIVFALLLVMLVILSQLGLMMVKFFQLATCAYDDYKKQKSSGG